MESGVQEAFKRRRLAGAKVKQIPEGKARGRPTEICIKPATNLVFLKSVDSVQFC